MTTSPPSSDDLPALNPQLDAAVQRDMRNSMRLEWRSPRTLNPHAKNWKSHQGVQRNAYSDLKGEVGWAGALLFNERTETLLDGHMRLQDSLESNEDEVPVLVIDVPYETELKILAFLDLVGSLFKTRQSALDQLSDLVETRSALLRSLAGGDVPDGEDDPFKDEQEETAAAKLPEGGLSLVLGEEYNYIVLLFKTPMDWTAAQDHFSLKRTRCAFNSGIGVGRVVDGGEYLKRVYHTRLGLDGQKGAADGLG